MSAASSSDQTPKAPVAPLAAVKKPVNSTLGFVYIALVVLCYVGASFGGGIVAVLGYSLATLGHGSARQWATGTVVGQFTFTLLTYAIFLAAIIWLFRLTGVRWRDISLKKPHWIDPVYALLALPAYYILYGIALQIVQRLAPHFNANQSQDIGYTGAHGPALILVFTGLAIVPPIVEEIITRGYLYTGLKKAWPTWLAVIATSLVFASGHLEFGSGGPLVWVAALFTLVLSFILIGLRELTGRLWAGVFLHALVNGTSFLALFILHAK